MIPPRMRDLMMRAADLQALLMALVQGDGPLDLSAPSVSVEAAEEGSRCGLMLITRSATSPATVEITPFGLMFARVNDVVP